MTYDYSFTQNRELSWLSFNERVLDEACDGHVPPVERWRFMGIAAANLDEFFMIRVGSLYGLREMDAYYTDNKSGLTVGQQLGAILARTRLFVMRYDKALQEIEGALCAHGVERVEPWELGKAETRYVDNYFKVYIAPILSPQIVDKSHPFIHMQNGAAYVVSALADKEKHKLMGITPIPASLPSFIQLPGKGTRYVLTESVVLHKIEQLYKHFDVQCKACVMVIRNADINLDDEAFDVDGDYHALAARIKKKRDRLQPVRVDIRGEINKWLMGTLVKRLRIGDEYCFNTPSPLGKKYIGDVIAHLSPHVRAELSHQPYEGTHPDGLKRGDSVLERVQRGDLLLHYPYESMEPFIHLLRECAYDGDTLSIRICIYRLSVTSRIVELLCTAAENGVDVLVVLELKARFDETNNIRWAERLQEAGCRVIYGIEHYKIHAKLCLITRRTPNGVSHVTHIGTGNYNERTAKLYTDLSLITADPVIGGDAHDCFTDMLQGNLCGEYKALLAAPHTLGTGIARLIDEQIARAEGGLPARIVFKLNSITERGVIDKLSEASCAGVEILLIVRGICCILPGIPGRTDNIRVISVVGRFLEHSRVYCFGMGDDAQVYIASADLMTRNLERRIELACPIRDNRIKRRILSLLEDYTRDNVKARLLRGDGTYGRVDEDAEGDAFDVQAELMKQSQSYNAPNT